MAAGLTVYQAGCVSPLLWFLLLAGLASLIVEIGEIEGR
jgi:hypothetical protein